MAVYTYHEDACHAWLQVPRAELFELGIAHEISNCSHVDEELTNVYLEYHCDLPVFQRARHAPSVPPSLTPQFDICWPDASRMITRSYPGRSYVQFLPRFTPPLQALARAEEAYANNTLDVEQIRALAVAYGRKSVQNATIRAIRAVLGRHASPPSHCTDTDACDKAQPRVARSTFKAWDTVLYGDVCNNAPTSGP